MTWKFRIGGIRDNMRFKPCARVFTARVPFTAVRSYRTSRFKSFETPSIARYGLQGCLCKA